MAKFKKWIVVLLIVFDCFSATAIESPLISPPAVEVNDDRGVNLVTATLSKRLETVSIGGERGLKHSIGLYADLWADGTFHGFIDHYAGRASYQNISGINAKTYSINQVNGEIRSLQIIPAQLPAPPSERLHVMRVYGPVGSQDFIIRNSSTQALIKNYINNPITSGYEYVAVGDSRHRLEETSNPSRLKWTAPDGTVSVYEKGNSQSFPAASGGRLLEVIYPNGFKIRVGSFGVSTNTGYMLKYHTVMSIPNTPYEVVALNLAHEYCSSEAQTCNVSSEWPVASFIWPADTPNVYKQGGLPLSSYLFKVLDGNGGVTEVQYAPNDICINEFGNLNQNCAGNPPGGRRWQLRLAGIKNPGSAAYNYEYKYMNVGQSGGDSRSDSDFFLISTRAGRLTSGKLNGNNQPYLIYKNSSQNPYNNENSGGHIFVQSSTDLPGTIKEVRLAKAGTYRYHEDLRRLVSSFTPVAGAGPAKTYKYEGPRNNLNRIIGPNNITLSEATYDNNFINNCPTAKAKICNSPISVTDARGNTTTYEYDPDGRFAAPIKITEPTDLNGVHKITYYKYEEHKASYKNSAGNFADDESPIWLLTEEHTCRTSAANTSGCAAGDNDMVKTDYYYGPKQGSGLANNLHLRGKSIKAEGNNGALETRVWCYEYDKFGNMIGETQPKGNSTDLEACP